MLKRCEGSGEEAPETARVTGDGSGFEGHAVMLCPRCSQKVLVMHTGLIFLHYLPEGDG